MSADMLEIKLIDWASSNFPLNIIEMLTYIPEICTI